jgi:hypothetical protein
MPTPATKVILLRGHLEELLLRLDEEEGEVALFTWQPILRVDAEGKKKLVVGIDDISIL